MGCVVQYSVVCVLAFAITPALFLPFIVGGNIGRTFQWNYRIDNGRARRPCCTAGRGHPYDFGANARQHVFNKESIQLRYKCVALSWFV